MMYYILNPNLSHAGNRKIAELHKYLDKYRECIILDEATKKGLVEDLSNKVAELNAAYTRTKPLKIREWHNLISGELENSPIADPVFTICLHEVRYIARMVDEEMELLSKDKEGEA